MLEPLTEVWGWGWGVPRTAHEPELGMRLIMTILSHDNHAAELEQFPILRVRTDVHVLAPGALPRQEVGKARRVWERLDDRDPLAP